MASAAFVTLFNRSGALQRHWDLYTKQVWKERAKGKGVWEWIVIVKDNDKAKRASRRVKKMNSWEIVGAPGLTLISRYVQYQEPELGKHIKQ